MKRIIFKRPSKKVLLIGAVIALILILAAYVAYSLLFWQKYQHATTSNIAALEKRLDATLGAQDTQQPGKWAVVVSQIVEYKDSSQKVNCQAPVIVAWQSRLVAEWLRAVESCQNSIEHSSKVVKQLETIVRYVEGQRTIANIMEPLQGLSAEQGEESWQEAYEVWQRVAQSLEGAVVSAEAQSLLGQTQKATVDVRDAWEVLLRAHNEKNSSAFAKAKEALPPAYEAFGVIAQSSTIQMKQYLDDFAVIYDASQAS